MRVEDRRAEAAALEDALLLVGAVAARAHALELAFELDFVGDRVFGEAVDAVAADQPLADLFGLKRGDRLAERAGVRRDDAADGVAHANQVRAFQRGDHFDPVLEAHRQADRLAELAAQLLEGGRRRVDERGRAAGPAPTPADRPPRCSGRRLSRSM